MGCASSDRKDAGQLNREKMLIEYLNGLNRRPVREVNGFVEENENWQDLIEQYEIGDLITAPDGSQIQILEKDAGKVLKVECLNCSMKLLRINLKDHFASSKHLDFLF